MKVQFTRIVIRNVSEEQASHGYVPGFNARVYYTLDGAPETFPDHLVDDITIPQLHHLVGLFYVAFGQDMSGIPEGPRWEKIKGELEKMLLSSLLASYPKSDPVHEQLMRIIQEACDVLATPNTLPE